MAHREYLDLSSVELDRSHMPAKNGGEVLSYQGRKGCKTSNALFISDSQGCYNCDVYSLRTTSRFI